MIRIKISSTVSAERRWAKTNLGFDLTCVGSPSAGGRCHDWVAAVWGGMEWGHWVWNVAFDGIGSTALATGAALVFLRWQLRAQGDETRAAAEADRALTRDVEFRTACRDLARRAQGLLDDALTPARTTTAYYRQADRVFIELLEVRRRIELTEPVLAQFLLDVISPLDGRLRVATAPSIPVVQDVFNRYVGGLQTVVNLLSARAVESVVEGASQATVESVGESIRRGVAVNYRN